MATEVILDFDRLLAPVSPERPGGCELKSDPTLNQQFFGLKTAREVARDAERHALQPPNPDEPKDWVEEARLAWRAVIGGSTREGFPKVGALQILATGSKDLSVAAWLLEAMVREHGFAGLRDGLRLVRELAERFWPDIHPAPDEDGYATTVLHLSGLFGVSGSGTLVGPIHAIPITERPFRLSGVDYHYAFDESRTAVEMERRDRLKGEFEQAARETPADFFRNLIEDVQSCLDELSQMASVLALKCDGETSEPVIAPRPSQVEEALQQSMTRLRFLRGGDENAKSATTDSAEPGESGAPAPQETSLPSSGSSMNRETALQSLKQIAAFFRRTEPHSPVSYALEQVVRWGRMSLPDLLADLIDDQASRATLFRRTGIPDPARPESGDG